VIALALLAVHVQVIVPDAHNLQDLAFFVAQGAGYFKDEGLELDLAVPDAPSEARKLLDKPDAQAAVLPPPMYIDLIADKAPWRLAANLMQNDGIDVIVRRSVFDSRKLSTKVPVAERLRALKGLKMGVAPGPRSRLKALFEATGVPESTVEIVILTGHEQNGAWADGKIDVLFAHTPYLEKALVEQDAVMLIDQSAGEVKALASRQIHALCVSASFAEKQPELVKKLVRAIARAETLIHKDLKAAVRAAAVAQPGRDPKQLERIVEIYQPAMPATPAVTVEGIRGALPFYPSGKVPPELPKDLSAYVIR
jgi:ABC-type nitrate/sulfonate/bicarbonate transport system substrate-binding protein